MMAMLLGRSRWSTVRNTTTCPRRGVLGARSLQALRRIERRVDDTLVAGAPAEVARDRDPHLLLGRVRIVAQEFDEGGQHAGRAEAALQAVIVAECLLQRVQLLVVRRDALD